MAGIGFELRKLLSQGTLTSFAAGYGQSAIAAAGPWLLTVVTIAAIPIALAGRVSPEDLTAFHLVVMYNFAFSLVLSGPLVGVATRFLADALFKRDLRECPGMLIGGLAILLGLQLLFAAPFYLLYVDAEPRVRLLGLANYFLTSGIWLATVFVSSVKRHRAVSGAFGAGMLTGFLAICVLGPRFALAGLLAGFNTGLMVVLFALLGLALAEFPYEARNVWRIWEWFRRHPELAASGLVYNAALWIDKWVFWSSPQAEWIPMGLVSMPLYDSAMFLAFLTMTPALALFLLRAETGFFERYMAYSRAILELGTWEDIEAKHRALIEEIWVAGKSILLTQVGIGLGVILLAPRIFGWLHLEFSQYGAFRLGVLGAVFHVLFLFITIVLAYFELHRPVLALQALFFLLNLGGTLVTVRLGFAWYGFGYLTASVIAFVGAFLVLARALNELPYITFIAANPSVQQQES
ncbi:MAG: exopolysaccharide Pel transporter PelG [Bryobacterales bacterium]|nr:exopolysaccharide Pel transporter PelG [Bryobacterales bacterium]